MSKLRLVLSVVSLLLALAGVALWGAVRVVSWWSPPAEPPRRIFLPVARGGNSAAATRLPDATLGPSPTPTRSPTAGPTPTATSTPTVSPTPQDYFDVGQGVWPESGIVGTEFVFTVGLINTMEVPVQVTLVDRLPVGLSLSRVWPPSGTVLEMQGNAFTATLTVQPDRAANLFFLAIGAPSCPRCYVRNDASWSAVWPGGNRSGMSSSQPIQLINVTPTPTPTTGAPPTQTATALPTATVPGPTATRTPQPTLGPSPTPTLSP